jgi:hypothetical protein
MRVCSRWIAEEGRQIATSSSCKKGDLPFNRSPRDREELSGRPMARHPMIMRSPMAVNPHCMVRSWAWRTGMDHGDARNEGEKDKNEKAYFGEG